MTPQGAPRRTAFHLSQLGHLATRRFAEAAGELGVTPPEAGALRLLGHNPGLSQRALAGRLAAAPSRVVVLIDSLEGKGLVRRQRSDTDRRNYELHLTDDGDAVLGRLRRVAQEHETSFLEPLSDRERDQLGRLVAKLGAAHGLDPEVHAGYRG